MRFYRDSVTDLSWQLLQRITRQYQIVVVGGWAVWLYTKQLKSKDIDIVIELSTLERLRQEFEIFKNERLKKYELRMREVEVDVYVPFYSVLGVEVQKIIEDAKIVEGFKVPAVELLWVLKLVAWGGRRGSAKGRKDFLDLVSLLETGLEPDKLGGWVRLAKVEQVGTEFKEELQRTTEVGELGWNRHQVVGMKKRWKSALAILV